VVEHTAGSTQKRYVLYLRTTTADSLTSDIDPVLFLASLR